jgi:lysozyme family protein
MVDFNVAFERVVGHEGKFQDHRNDRGNWTSGIVGQGELKGTKFGIAAHSYPHLDIKNLTLSQAKEIYHRDFWLACRGDRLDNALVFQLFDAAFHHGIRNALRMLQRAVNVKDDGHIGPVTERAIQAMSVHDVLKRFLAQRIRFMTALTTFNDFGRGWMNRIAHNLEYAAYDTLD